MKVVLITILLFLSNFVKAQSNVSLKELARRAYLEKQANYYQINFYAKDNLTCTKDLIVILHISSGGKVLRKEYICFIDTIKTDSSVVIYNAKGLEKYGEHWTFVSIVYDSPEIGMTEFPRLKEPVISSFYRMEYNSNDKITLLASIFYPWGRI